MWKKQCLTPYCENALGGKNFSQFCWSIITDREMSKIKNVTTQLDVGIWEKMAQAEK